MPLVISALAPGFIGHETRQLAVDDSRLMLPYLAFAGPVAVMMGLLNAESRFALTAFAPVLFNLALIVVMLALLVWRQDASTAALVTAATVGIAGLLQLLILVLPGGSLATPPQISFDAGMRGFFPPGDPRHDRQLRAAIARGGRRHHRVVIAIGGVVAVFRQPPGRIAARYCRRRHGTVLVPELTRALRGGDRRAMVQAESRGLELAVGLALPATLGLIVLSGPVVRMLFEHGVFTAADTLATAHALMLLALGLPAYVLVKALSPACFARDDTTTPLLATLKGLAVAIVSALVIRPVVRRRRHRGQHRLGSMEQRHLLDPAWGGELRIFNRRRCTAEAAADRPRSHPDGRSAVAHGAFCAAMGGRCASPRAGRYSGHHHCRRKSRFTACC